MNAQVDPLHNYNQNPNENGALGAGEEENNVPHINQSINNMKRKHALQINLLNSLIGLFFLLLVFLLGIKANSLLYGSRSTPGVHEEAIIVEDHEDLNITRNERNITAATIDLDKFIESTNKFEDAKAYLDNALKAIKDAKPDVNPTNKDLSTISNEDEKVSKIHNLTHRLEILKETLKIRLDRVKGK